MPPIREKLISWGVPLGISAALILVFHFGFQIDSTNPGPTGWPSDKEEGKPFASPQGPTSREQQKKDQATLEKALFGTQASACRSITQEALRFSCEDTLNYSVILKTKDPARCSILHDAALRTECEDNIYLMLAEESRTLALCDKIQNEALKLSCQKKVQTAIGFESGDCKAISDPVLRQNCLDNAVASSAVQKGNSASCNSIKDPSKKTQCLFTVQQNKAVLASKTAINKINEFKTTDQKLAACSNLQSPLLAQRCKDQANVALALEKKDLSTYCNKVLDAPLKTNCFAQQSAIDQATLRQALDEQNSVFCKSIKNTELKTLCQKTADGTS